MNKPGISIVTIFSKKNVKELKVTLKSIKFFESNIKECLIIGGEKKQYNQIKRIIFHSFEKEFQKKFKLFIERDDGVSNAFNKGIMYSNFEYILFCNAGDKLINLPKIKDCDQIIMPSLLQRRKDGSLKLIKSKNYNTFPNRYVHPGAIISKDTFCKIGLFKTKLKVSMDYDFFCRANSYGIKFRIINKPNVEMEPSGLSGHITSWKQFYEPLAISYKFCPIKLLVNLPPYLMLFLYKTFKKFYLDYLKK